MEEVIDWMHAERAEAVSALDVSHLLGGAVGESFVFGTGRSRVHMLNIAKAVRYEMKHRGVVMNGEPPMIEGKHSDDWLLIDGGSVVVSVMLQATRESLSLEQYWEDMGALPIDVQRDGTLDSNPSAPWVPAAIGALSTDANVAVEHWGAAADDDAASLDPLYRDDDDAGELDVQDPDVLDAVERHLRQERAMGVRLEGAPAAALQETDGLAQVGEDAEYYYSEDDAEGEHYYDELGAYYDEADADSDLESGEDVGAGRRRPATEVKDELE